MKRFWTCLIAVLVLTSCTPVEDFGPDRTKASSTRRSQDRGRRSGGPAQEINSVPGPDVLRFTKDESSYLAYAINPIDLTEPPDVIEQQRAVNAQAASARTLRISKHLFLMQHGPGSNGTGCLVRYKNTGSTLNEYWMENGIAVDFLQSKHPTAKNIRKNIAEGTYVEEIGTFDDEVLQVLCNRGQPRVLDFISRYKEADDALVDGRRRGRGARRVSATIAACAHHVDAVLEIVSSRPS